MLREITTAPPLVFLVCMTTKNPRGKDSGIIANFNK